jgi:hypothetical protein
MMRDKRGYMIANITSAEIFYPIDFELQEGGK